MSAPASSSTGFALAEAEPVDLAVDRQPGTVRAEHHRGVPQAPSLRPAVAVRGAFGQPLDHRPGVHHRTHIAGRRGDRRHRRAVQHLGPLRPAAVREATVRPQLRQHDEIGATLGTHQVGDPGDPVGHGLVVGVGHLDQVHSHHARHTNPKLR
jgi:hypothetical protein